MRVYLADKSAYARRKNPAVATVLTGLVESDGALAACGITALELCYSARNRADYEAMHADLSALRWLETRESDLRRAWAVQRALVGRGQHRLSIPDMLIAAVAERTGAIVLHYDRDYELISAVTGQQVRWIVPAGSV